MRGKGRNLAKNAKSEDQPGRAPGAHDLQPDGPKSESRQGSGKKTRPLTWPGFCDRRMTIAKPFTSGA